MERKLVTIRRISKILPIEGKDLIALAIIDGWSVIIKKTEFKVNDLCLFFEIDSFIPESDERFKFLKAVSIKKDFLIVEKERGKVKASISTLNKAQF